MPRFALLLAAGICLLTARPLCANEDGDDKPPISITSPDVATTFAYSSVKSHTLIWYPREKVLVARITFTDSHSNNGSSDEDTQEFKFPGVSFDEKTGFFIAKTEKGEVIPIARYKKAFLFTTVQTTPNAAVRVLHPRGNVTVILEAISPNDPAMHPRERDPDGEHKIDSHSMLNGQ